MFAAESAHGGAEHAHSASTEWLLMLLSVGVALAGIALARYMYHWNRKAPDAVAASLPGMHRTLTNLWYVDKFYGWVFVDGLAKGGGEVMSQFDNNVVDGGVNGTGWLTRLTSSLSIWWDTWIVDGAVRLTGFLVKVLSYPARLLQTGSVQAYALIFVLGVVLLFAYYLSH
jgi:NADH-quinone oxidoreductase subunit L